MALPTIFATQPTGNVPASDLDANFNAVAAMGIMQCTASGTNSITLTPAANQPAVSAYANYQQFSFVPAATPTGSVSLQVGSLALLPLYYADGKTQASVGAFTAVQLVIMVYNSALNSGAGGFQIVSLISASQIPGTTTNDNAASGNVGEYISSNLGSGSAITMSSETTENITSISLTPGDWDVYINLKYLPASAKTILLAYASLSTTSGVLDSTDFGFSAWLGSFTGDGSSVLGLSGGYRLSLATTTTVYAVAFVATSGTINVFGGLWARRVR